MKLLIALLALIPSLALAQTCATGQSGVAPTATLTFTAPTQNTDGSAIKTPLTYNLYQGTSPSTLTKVSSGLTGSPIAVSTGLASATTVYFALTVVDANGTESVQSNAVCKSFPKSTPDTITITIT